MTITGDLSGKKIFITGGSRGIGLAIAKRAAQDGAMIAIAGLLRRSQWRRDNHEIIARPRWPMTELQGMVK